MTREYIAASVVVITKNEERNIAKCLRSVDHFAEVFVVDSASTDRTQEIASSLGASVIEFHWNGLYPKKKQWCLENLPFNNDWILWVDADEEVYPELADEIQTLISGKPSHAGYYIGYDYVFMGRVLRHGQRVFKLVLHQRGMAKFVPQDDLDAKKAGDQEVHVQPQIDGSVGVLKQRMLHRDHDNLHHYVDRHNWYSDWEAVLRARKLPVNSGEPQPGVRGMLKHSFNALPGKPILVFFYSYVIRAGYLDGNPGLNYALSKAFYYWLIGIKTNEKKRQMRDRS